MVTRTAIRIAVVGAGPVGLALALLASRHLPQAQVTLFDTRPLDRDVSGDPRTLALSLGSVQLLKRLAAWPAADAAPILAVHVSQAPPSFGDATVRLSAAEQAVPMLGAVLPYGRLVAPLQAAWVAAADGSRLQSRLQSRFGTPVAAIKALPEGVEVDAGIAETFDLAVVAEGGVFSDQVAQGDHARLRPDGLGRHASRSTAAHPAWPSSASRATARRRCCRCRRRPTARPAPRWCGACRATTTRCASSTPRSAWRC